MGLEISLNGISTSGLLQASITANNYFSADSFSLTFAAGANPAEDIASWMELADKYVEVNFCDASVPFLTNIVTGTIDILTADPILKTISVEGRDLSASLIDSYVQQDFVNQTASEVVEAIAARYGLPAQVTATSSSVGRYFADGYTKLSLGQFSSLRSNWDLVVELAREANFDIFMQGRTLVFQPATDGVDPAVVIGPSDVITMRLERSVAIGSSPRVRVQSWDSQAVASYGAITSDPGSTDLPGSRAVDSQTYLFSRSNLTPSQADLSVQRYAAEINRLRTTLHFEMPWDLRFTPRSLVRLQGTASAFDGLYQIDCVERRYSTISGSVQSVHAVSWPILVL